MTVELSGGALKGIPATQTGTNRTAISFAILKEYYTEGIRDLLNSRTVLLKYMNRSERFKVDGSYYVVPLRISRNEGFGHIAEGGALPDPGTQGYDRASYFTMNYYGRIKFSGPSAAATATRRGSFIDIVDAEVSGVVQDMARDMNIVAFCDGTGRRARVVTTTTGSQSVISVDNPGGFTNLGPGTQYLRRGMRVAIIDATDVLRAVRYLGTVNYETNQVTLTQSNLTTVSAFDFTTGGPFYLARVSNATTTSLTDCSYLREPEGLASIISDENPFGLSYGGFGTAHLLGQLDRSTLVPWRAIVLDNGGIPVDFYPGMFQKLLDEMEKAGPGTAQVFITTHGIRLAYFDSLQAARRYPNTMKFDGGFETLHYADRPIVPDRDCTKGRIYGIDFEVLQAYYEEDYHWMDRDGSFLNRMADQDAYQATLVRYHQFGTDAPNRLGLIADVRDD